MTACSCDPGRYQEYRALIVRHRASLAAEASARGLTPRQYVIARLWVSRADVDDKMARGEFTGPHWNHHQRRLHRAIAWLERLEARQ